MALQAVEVDEAGAAGVVDEADVITIEVAAAGVEVEAVATTSLAKSGIETRKATRSLARRLLLMAAHQHCLRSKRKLRQKMSRWRPSQKPRPNRLLASSAAPTKPASMLLLLRRPKRKTHSSKPLILDG